MDQTQSLILALHQEGKPFTANEQELTTAINAARLHGHSQMIYCCSSSLGTKEIRRYVERYTTFIKGMALENECVEINYKFFNHDERIETATGARIDIYCKKA